ncbi:MULTISPECIES: 50S ribosomal protein L18 [unclassified Synechococcus]|jgi:large subunit ribosomal protein L18|uniref:50S ribosomal protein L18 n=1 Tax=unclassified Synechococcus TaxID=2626047 RepID=UPI000B6C7C9B|nr:MULTISPECIES: 50S ribosomal protein L18 [unclassified Synechococcus]MAS27927.1 50S ribosomal protein L18 [Synechococcus sp. NAT40]OUW49538.1 MAG: 50S ribosomal protein L18 [Synechococcus sp. TMED187]RZO15143.1 MAG: 50S ribosomal protein L18 [Synechococcus sp. MED-G135]|tara:strand:+ start:146 stop:514 length:369 start_codon:yes stop_codon:yes gene_type:complete
MSTLSRKQQTQKRHRRLRRHLNGSATRPRLAVFRSNNHIYAQVIDDDAQSTLCSASTVDKELRTNLKADGSSCDASVAVGSLLAKRAIAKGIQQVVFDRGGNLYHGRVQALADAAREAGLQF